MGVSVHLIAIPDGLDAVKQVLRLTVQVSPTIPTGAVIGRPLSLDRWPEEIAALARSMRIEFKSARGESAGVDCASELSQFFQDPHPTEQSYAEAATKLWRKVFRDDAGLADLEDALRPENNKNPWNEEMIAALASTRAGDLSRVMRVLGECRSVDLSEASAGRIARRRSTLIRNWLGPFAKEGMTESRYQDFAKASWDTPAWPESSRRVGELTKALQSHLESGTTLEPHHRQQLDRVLANVLLGIGYGRTRRKLPMDPEKLQRAKGRMFGLQGLSSLAHFVGLAVQLRIPVAALGGIDSGVVCASFNEAHDVVEQSSSWTAFEVASSAKGHPDYFGPQPKSKPDTPIYPMVRGNIDLGAESANTPRFALEAADDINSLFRCIQVLASASDEEGEIAFDQLRRGIALIDHQRRQHVQLELSEPEPGLSPDDPLYAQHLIVGLRPDVAVAEKNANTLLQSANRWRSLTRRSVQCGEALMGEFYNHRIYREIASHDHGYAVSKVRLDLPVVEAELLCWAGSSLAISARGQQMESADDEGPGIALTYRLDDSASDADRMPPLREGFGYVMACRAAFRCGAGPRFEEARERYARTSSMLIGRDGEPFLFPAESRETCTVHLVRNDPLATQANLEPYQSESLTRLVVRDGGRIGKQKQRRRVLLPHRVSFDAAELQSQFDTAQQVALDVPSGMCSKGSKVPLVLFANAGEMPEARDGKVWYHLDDGKRTLIDVETGKSTAKVPNLRGSVALFGSHAAASKTQFYAGRNDRVVLAGVRLTSAGGTDEWLELPLGFEFWKEDDEPSTGLPIVLSLETGKSNSARAGTATVDGYSLPAILVTLQPAATAKAHLASVPVNLFEPRRQLEIDLIHAVEKPLATAGTSWNGRSGKRPAALGVGMVAIATENSEKADVDWQRYITGKASDQMLCWESQPGGNRSYFVGRLVFDRGSTGRIRLTLKWDEYDQRRLVRNPQATSVATAPDGQAWLERSHPMSAHGFDAEVESAGNPRVFDMLEVTDKVLRNLSFAFHDGRARFLVPTLNSVSRFANCYAAGNHELENTELPGFWSQCTFRPPPPAIEFIQPDMDWRSWKESTRGARVITRSNSFFRIYVDEGWYASGEGEVIGVVLKPPAMNTRELPDSYLPFVSRFARDPVRAGPFLAEGFLGRDQLSAKIVEDVEIVLSKVPEEVERKNATIKDRRDAVFLDVAVLEPRKDESSGALYFDLEIKEADIDAPMLHLGLVRFQPHAVQGLRSSAPVLHALHLKPRRRLRVSSPQLHQRTVSLDRAEASLIGDVAGLVELRLVKRVDSNGRWERCHEEPMCFELPKGQKNFTHTFDLPQSGEFFGLILEEREFFSPIRSPKSPTLPVFSTFVALGTKKETTW